MQIRSSIKFPTYMTNNALTSTPTITNDSCVAQIYCKISTFKKALKELSFLHESTPIILKFHIEYPYFSIVYNDVTLNDNYCVIKFAADPGDVRYTIKSSMSVKYTIGSLREVFGGFAREGLSCAVLVDDSKVLSVKIVQGCKDVYIESIVMPLDDGDDID